MIPTQASTFAVAAAALFVASGLATADPALTVSLPGGAPDLLQPGEATPFSVQIVDGTESYLPGTATLHYRYDGGVFNSASLVATGGTLYQTTLPPAGCSAIPEFYVTAEGDGGSTVASPSEAPSSVYTSLVGEVVALLADDFETDQGWVAVNLGATSGDWQRGVPVNDPGWAYDPETDSDGSGRCYLTQNEAGNTDVDGGAVRLTSPAIDMSGGGISIGYDYFLRLTDDDGSDRLLVEISGNGEAGPWIEIARHDTDGGLDWRHWDITQQDLDDAGVTLTDQAMLRFTTNDADPQSINESALDAVQITGFECVPVDGACCYADGACDIVDTYADCDGMWQGEASSCDPNPCPQPCTDPGDVNVDDLLNGLDIQAFADCLLTGQTLDGNCTCADVTGEGVADVDDAQWLAFMLARGDQDIALDVYCSETTVTLRVFEDVLYEGQAEFTETLALSTRGHSDAVLLRSRPPYADCYEAGECLPGCPEVVTELVGLELAGPGPSLGDVVIARRDDRVSDGGICCLDADDEGEFLSGDSYMTIFPRVHLPAYDLAFDTGDQPVRLQAGNISSLPPDGAEYLPTPPGGGVCGQPGAPESVPLFLAGSTTPAGELTIAAHRVGCPPPIGACCGPAAGCSITTEDDCAAAGNDYLGDETACTPNPCCEVLLSLDEALLLGQSIEATASAVPEGGTCQWEATYTGSGRVEIDAPEACSTAITASAASSAAADVEIRVVYTSPEGNTCDDTQSLTVGRVSLKQLTFTGSDLRNVARDSTGSSYGTPHWLDTDDDGDAADPGERRFPVAYRRTTSVAVSNVRFAVSPPGLVGSGVPVRGMGPDGDFFEGVGNMSGGELVVSATMTSTDALPDSVRFYDTYNVVWEIAPDGVNYLSAGTSDNRLYVTLNNPTASPLYETCIELACANADGETTTTGAVAMIWEEFIDRDVSRKPLDGYNYTDGVRMGYWRPIPEVCQSLSAMLASPIGNGSCVAWSYMLESCIRTQGISGTSISQITADTTVCPGATGFLVQNWGFGGNIRTGSNGVNDSTLAGDDVEIVVAGEGFPHSTCITAGANGVLDSMPGGDDVQTGDEINTGLNGLCDTVAAGDDSQGIPFGQGDSHESCILAGPNGVMDSTVGGDDVSDSGTPGGGFYPYTIGSSVNNLPGIGGQDNPEPPEAFYNHFIVKYGGMIYDPSYGAGPYGSENAHENAAIDGIRSGSSARKNSPQASELDYD